MRGLEGGGPVLVQNNRVEGTMFGKLAAAAVAALFMTVNATGDAMADHRKKHRKWLDPGFYGVPDVIRMPRPMRYVFGGYIVDGDAEDLTLYGSDEEFDESYYDPSHDLVSQPPPAKKTAAVTKAPLAKPKIAKKPVSTAASAKPAAKKQVTSTPSAPAPVESEPEAKAVKTAAAPILTCEKAGQIVAGYGFIDVKPKSCDGLLYEFDAERDGKAFAIKIDRGNGELSEVTKLP